MHAELGACCLALRLSWRPACSPKRARSAAAVPCFPVTQTLTPACAHTHLHAPPGVQQAALDIEALADLAQGRMSELDARCARLEAGRGKLRAQHAAAAEGLAGALLPCTRLAPVLHVRKLAGTAQQLHARLNHVLKVAVSHLQTHTTHTQQHSRQRRQGQAAAGAGGRAPRIRQHRAAAARRRGARRGRAARRARPHAADAAGAG